MSEIDSHRSTSPTFSLLTLLALTAFIAIGTAVGLATYKNRVLLQQRDELLALSSRLQIANHDELASVELPRVADDFHSWRVHVPDGEGYELRLGIGPISENGIPPVVGSVPISAGRHRVTLHAEDSPSEQFRFAVFVNGELALEKVMGSEWIPGGWSSSSGISWPPVPQLSPAPLQLAARSYRPNVDFGRGNYFNGQSDDFVTRTGYRLWLDQADRSWASASPFLGLQGDPSYYGIGLRDGLRYKPSRLPYLWTFTRPSLDTDAPVLTIAAEFFDDEGVVLSSQTPEFQSWQLHNDALAKQPRDWQLDPARSSYTAFLQANLEGAHAPSPVVEMQWDVQRPDQVGLRLAQTPANQRLTRWRLRILDGTQQLWRELHIGKRAIDAEELKDSGQADLSQVSVPLDLSDSSAEKQILRWQTNETLPLQVLERKQAAYVGLGRYQGLPLRLAVQIPSTLHPTLQVSVVEDDPNAPDTPFPGGAVIDQLQIDLDATSREWIWIEAKRKP